MYRFSGQFLHGLAGHGTPAARALLQRFQNTQFVTHHAPRLHRRQQMTHEQTQQVANSRAQFMGGFDPFLDGWSEQATPAPLSVHLCFRPYLPGWVSA